MDTQFNYWKSFKYIWKNLICESPSPTRNLMEPKYRSVLSDDNLVFKLRCALGEGQSTTSVAQNWGVFQEERFQG